MYYTEITCKLQFFFLLSAKESKKAPLSAPFLSFSVFYSVSQLTVRGVVQDLFHGRFPVDLPADRTQKRSVTPKVFACELCITKFTGNHGCLRMLCLRFEAKLLRCHDYTLFT